ncbi:permease prefix domain 1-containing protein [Amycolatopsis pittospori]|uniref:permease prefix domain 1-containing protein n=1 Tax=Amycolatopsis pittospori TaxID=2749434 RepID=UPI0015F100B9|nr:permease prefix domain 1-containing protein [Amycolatopsis pittospori]
MSAIETYIAELDRRLSGSAGAKADLLTEARDGLHDAADAYREGGVDEAEAERRAVADFGPVDVIAPAYQAELGLRRDIRVLWELIVGVPLLILSWDLARTLSLGDWSRFGDPPPSWYHHAIGAADTVAALSPVVAVAGVIAARLLSRRTDGPRAARSVSLSVAVALGLNLIAVALYGGATGLLEPARLIISVPCAVLSATWILFSMRLTVAARRHRRPGMAIAA